MSQPVRMVPADTAEPVTLINAFSVPVEESDRFLQRWTDNARVMAQQPGLIRARMFRSIVDDVELRFVNVAEWDSGHALDRARESVEWRASMRRIIDDPELHVTPRPGVYTEAIDVRPGDLLPTDQPVA